MISDKQQTVCWLRFASSEYLHWSVASDGSIDGPCIASFEDVPVLLTGVVIVCSSAGRLARQW